VFQSSWNRTSKLVIGEVSDSIGTALEIYDRMRHHNIRIAFLFSTEAALILQIIRDKHLQQCELF
jgi:hypothetical protein